MFKSKKFIIILVVIVIAVVTAIFVNKEENAATQQTKFIKPETGSIEEAVTAQGKLEPKEYVDVGTQVSGQLSKLYFEIGDTVKKGELLADIDPKIYQARVDADKASLTRLRAQYDQQVAQIELAKQLNNRNLVLIKSDAISKQALDESKAALKVAEAGGASIKAQIQEAESTLKGDEANLSYTKIYAPMDGVIVSESAKEGQTLNANQTAPTVLQVANLDLMTVRAQVAEADIMRLKQGMEVYFTVLGSLDRKWKGTVTQLLPSPETVNDVVLYIALIDVDNKDRQLLTGMSAQVFFQLGKADNTMLVPTTALGKRVAAKDNDQGSAYEIKVKQGREVVDKTIYVGLTSRGKAQVISGLNANDEIATNERPQAQSSGTQTKNASPRFGPRL